MVEEHERRDTPNEGQPLDVELSVVANLSVAFNAVTRNFGRLARDLRHLEGAERRAEFKRVGVELGQLGDLCHEIRVVFWECAGELSSQDGQVVARAAVPVPRWRQRLMPVLLVVLGVVLGATVAVLLVHK